MERLRDRTDELELIISSLTIFALFSLPGWLFNKLADVWTHFSTSAVIAGNLATTLVTGVCFSLGACFVIHLMVRAYWVGLIGLRAAFPAGIRWDRARGLGPLTRARYQQIIPEMGDLITRADRLASSLFAVISMLTLGTLWLGGIMLVTLVVAGVIGARFGLTNAAVGVAGTLLLVVFAGIPVLVYLLDAQLAARVTSLRENRPFQWVVGAFSRIAGLAYPKRLVLPVQLTLQTNLPPLLFTLGMTAAVIAILGLGNFRVAAWSSFTVSGAFDYLDAEDVRGGFRSAHYEDMSSDLDRLRAWPRISSFTQQGAFLRVFLPYQPLRDNLILEQLCSERDTAEPAALCLQKLWSLALDGKAQSVAGFLPAERADLAMRGLIGVLPLSALTPGLHELRVIWDPRRNGEAKPLDDRYEETRFDFRIPFVFSPDYELTLPVAR